jgi:hypothetical protein
VPLFSPSSVSVFLCPLMQCVAIQLAVMESMVALVVREGLAVNAHPLLH